MSYTDVVVESAPGRADQSDQRFLLEGVSWAAYVALRDSLDQAGRRHTRLTYLDGQLELLTTGQPHEESKKIISRLLETWSDELDVDLRGFGNMTLRHELRRRGLEPDECYSLGPKSEEQPPHIAIEVAVTSPLLDKLAVYAGLDVAEVWVWDVGDRTLDIWRLDGGAYIAHARSAILPALAPALLGGFIRPGESHTALARSYRTALRMEG